MPALLLYGFSQGEAVQLRTLLGFLQDVRVVEVPPAGYGVTIGDLLAGKTPPALAVGKPFARKLLVIDDAPGQMLNLLLSAAGQVTKGQSILRAVVTETNRTWSGSYLYEHLLEEEALLSGQA